MEQQQNNTLLQHVFDGAAYCVTGIFSIFTGTFTFCQNKVGGGINFVARWYYNLNQERDALALERKRLTDDIEKHKKAESQLRETVDNKVREKLNSMHSTVSELEKNTTRLKREQNALCSSNFELQNQEEQLQKQVKKLRRETQGLKDLKHSEETLRESVSELESRKNTLRSKVKTLETKISKLEKKEIELKDKCTKLKQEATNLKSRNHSTRSQQEEKVVNNYYNTSYHQHVHLDSKTNSSYSRLLSSSRTNNHLFTSDYNDNSRPALTYRPSSSSDD